MRATVTTRLLDQLNKVRGLTYPSIGYVYYADIKGDGQNHYAVWEVATKGGGVRRSHLNGHPRARCNAIRKAIKEAHGS